MAATGAERQRRHRLHIAGDHGECGLSCDVAAARQLTVALDEIATRARRLSVLLQRTK
jgi:hypothetical protein